jgi:hypothetical protein
MPRNFDLGWLGCACVRAWWRGGGGGTLSMRKSFIFMPWFMPFLTTFGSRMPGAFPPLSASLVIPGRTMLRQLAQYTRRRPPSEAARCITVQRSRTLSRHIRPDLKLWATVLGTSHTLLCGLEAHRLHLLPYDPLARDQLLQRLVHKQLMIHPLAIHHTHNFGWLRRVSYAWINVAARDRQSLLPNLHSGEFDAVGNWAILERRNNSLLQCRAGVARRSASGRGCLSAGGYPLPLLINLLWIYKSPRGGSPPISHKGYPPRDIYLSNLLY